MKNDTTESLSPQQGEKHMSPQQGERMFTETQLKAFREIRKDIKDLAAEQIAVKKIARTKLKDRATLVKPEEYKDLPVSSIITSYQCKLVNNRAKITALHIIFNELRNKPISHSAGNNWNITYYMEQFKKHYELM